MNDNPFLPPSSNLNARDTFGSTAEVSASVLQGLARTKGWVRFCAILMCIMVGLQALQVVFAVVGINTAIGAPQTRAFMVGSAFGGLLVSFLLYLWPAMRPLRYAKAIGFLLEQKTPVELEEALNIQRGFWKHIGIIVMLFLGFIVAAMFLAIAVAVAGRN